MISKYFTSQISDLKWIRREGACTRAVEKGQQEEGYENSYIEI
jgi:hypothetical protein